MCCLISAVLLLGPRGLMFIWWLVDPVRFAAVFDSFLLPVLGFFFLPWTTLVYVVVAPGGIETVEALGLGLAVIVDVGTFVAGGVSNSRRSAQGTF